MGHPVSLSEMYENDRVVWFRDGFPTHSALVSDMPDKDKRVVEFMYTRTAVVMDRIRCYVYCRSLAA